MLDDKIGFINSSGKVIIDFLFDETETFGEIKKEWCGETNL